MYHNLILHFHIKISPYHNLTLSGHQGLSFRDLQRILEKNSLPTSISGTALNEMAVTGYLSKVNLTQDRGSRRSLKLFLF